jgi:hypothetical protein
VFHLATGAIDPLIQHPAIDRRSGQRGDDEARIGAFGEVLGFADNPALAAPAVEGGVDELPKAPRRLAGLGLRGGRGGQVGLERGGQPGVAREAEHVMDPVRLAPRHPPAAGEGLGPLSPTPFRRPSDVRGPQPGREEMPTTEHVERHIAVAAVIAVEEPALLLTVQGVVGCGEIEDDLLERPRVRLQEEVDQQVGARAAGA